MRSLLFGLGLLISLHTAAGAVEEPALGPPRSLSDACHIEPMRIWEARRALPGCETLIGQLGPGHPGLASALAAKAILQRGAGQADYRDSVEAALRIDPTNLEAGLLQVEEAPGADATKERLERLLARYPDEPRVLRLYAQMRSMEGGIEDGLPFLRRAVEAAPKDRNLKLQFANWLHSIGNVEEAFLEVESLLSLLPGDQGALGFRAEIFLAMGEPERAVADAERSWPDNFGNLVVLAQAYGMLGRHEPALAAVENALRRHNGSLDTRPPLLLYKIALLHALNRVAETDAVLAEFAREDGKGHILRIQVMLRNSGFEDVAITGSLDAVTKRHLLTCLTTLACGGLLRDG